MLSTDKLKNKEVINIYDGKSLGFVYDIAAAHAALAGGKLRPESRLQHCPRCPQLRCD